jgi:hypothetical protein
VDIALLAVLLTSLTTAIQLPSIVANAPNQITCDLRGRADTALAPRDDRWPSVFLDDEIAEVPIWKTVSIGTYESPRKLREALDSARCSVGDLAAEALDDTAFPISESRATVELAVLTASELGFGAEGAPLREVYARAAKLGLELCPAEVGPQLRLQYTHQPLGEFLHIAMQPVATNRANVVALAIGNGGAGLLSLIGGDGRPDFVVPSTIRFVFVRRPSPGQHPRRKCGIGATADSRGRHRFSALKRNLHRKSLPAQRQPERPTDLVMRPLAKGEEREEQSQ